MNSKNKPEDVPEDPAVAESRDSTTDDGSYVGRAGGDESFDDEETGAEARAADDQAVQEPPD